MHSIPKKSIEELLQSLSDINPNQNIIFTKKKKITRNQLLNKILKVRSGLINIGLKRGDKVISLLDNSYDQIVLFFSCITLGIIWVPIGSSRKGLGLNYILSLINPKKIFSKKKNINHLPKKFIKKIFYINEGIKNLTKKNTNW